MNIESVSAGTVTASTTGNILESCARLEACIEHCANQTLHLQIRRRILRAHSCSLHTCQYNTRENAENGDDDQELDKGEAAITGMRAGVSYYIHDQKRYSEPV